MGSENKQTLNWQSYVFCYLQENIVCDISLVDETQFWIWAQDTSNTKAMPSTESCSPIIHFQSDRIIYQRGIRQAVRIVSVNIWGLLFNFSRILSMWFFTVPKVQNKQSSHVISIFLKFLKILWNKKSSLFNTCNLWPLLLFWSTVLWRTLNWILNNFRNKFKLSCWLFLN